MASTDRSAAVSHVGKVRSNNQDSGYAGQYLFLVADGMGGHAGGDVASAIAVKRITETDRQYTSPNDAEFALQSALLAANSLLAETVFEHGELTGMGTTVSGLLRVDNHVAIAHIGDSRIYLFRDGKLTQITNDHTFVQRLVDSGPASQQKKRQCIPGARFSCGCSVTSMRRPRSIRPETKAGDRWVICSDGLSSYVAEDKIATVLATVAGAKAALGPPGQGESRPGHTRTTSQSSSSTSMRRATRRTTRR